MKASGLSLAVASLVLASAATACSPGPVPVSQSLRDPSSPNAVEGFTPSVPAAVAMMSVAEPSYEHRAAPAPPADESASGDAVYACPMHPEFTSNAPGTCLKCNMKLVPKK